MIEAENLSKLYREKLVVDGLDFVVQPSDRSRSGWRSQWIMRPGHASGY
jgi:hypothetical protein